MLPTSLNTQTLKLIAIGAVYLLTFFVMGCVAFALFVGIHHAFA